MEAKPRELRYYVRADGAVVVLDWLDGLRDTKTRARLRIRLDRLESGNWGDSKMVGGAIRELRVDIGPGYRMYFALDGDRVVLLLCAGSKKTQTRDIQAAERNWNDYLKRKE